MGRTIELQPPALGQPVLEIAGQYTVFRLRRRTLDGRCFARGRSFGELETNAIPGLVANDFLRSSRDHARRRRGRLEVSVRHAIRNAELFSREARAQSDRLARRWPLGDAGH